MADQIAYVVLDAGTPYLVNSNNNPINDIASFPVATLGVNSTLRVRPIHKKDFSPYTTAELAQYVTWEFAVTEDYDDTTDPLFSYKAGTTITVVETVDNGTPYAEIVVVMAPTTQELIDYLTKDGATPYPVPRSKVYDTGVNDDLGNNINVGMKLAGFVVTDPSYPEISMDLPFLVRNNRKFNGPTTPLPPNYWTPEQIQAYAVGRAVSSMSGGGVINLTNDKVALYQSGIAKVVTVQDLADSIALGAQIPPVQNEYVDIAAMLADQGNQTEGYFQQVGTGKDTELYKKTAASTASIDDYDDVTIEPVQNIYADTVAMIAGQADQTAGYLQRAGDEYYEYLGTTVGDITDYKSVGGGMTTSVYDPAGVAEQLVGETATQSLSNKSLIAVNITDYTTYTPQGSTPAHATGRFYYDSVEHSFVAMNDISDVGLNVGEELWGRVSNDNGFTLENGKVGYVKGSLNGNLTCSYADATTLDTSIRAIGIFTNNILNGADGYITRFGEVRGVDTSAFTMGDILYVDPDNPGELTNVRPSAPNYPIRVGICLFADAVNGVVGVDTLAFNSSDTAVNIEGSINGVVIETPKLRFRDDAGTIKAELTNGEDETKNLNFIIDGMRYTLDTTTGPGPNGGQEVALTPGANSTTLFENFLYIWLNAGTPEFKASTTATPDDHCPVGKASLFDYTRTITDGQIYKWRRFNDAQDGGNDYGAYRRLVNAIRDKLGTTYYSGISGTTTVTNGSVTLSTTSGLCIQANQQSVAALDGTAYTIFNDNSNVATYENVTNLASIVETATGQSLAINGAYYRLKVYIQSASSNEGTLAATDKFVVTRPTGYYTSAADAINDINNYDVLINDIEIEGLVFPVFTLVIGRTGGSGATWTEIETQDNRSRLVGGNSGGAGSQGAAGADELVKISSNDTTTGYLNDKLVVDTTLSKTILSPSGNEQLQIKMPNTTVTPGAYTKADITVDAQGRITAATNGSEAAINGYTPPSGTNAVVDGNTLTANTVTNTFASGTDGTVKVDDSPANGTKFWLYVSGAATVTVNFVSGGAAIPETITNANGSVCIEYDTPSSSYRLVRGIEVDISQVTTTGDAVDTTYSSDGSGGIKKTKNNLIATTAPTTTDDSAAGYAVGSKWIDVTNDKVYECVDSTASAAVWIELSATGGNTPPSTTNAVVDTNTLTADTVTNTFAGATDGTVKITDAPSHGTKYWLYVSGTASVRVELVTAGTAVIPTVTNVDEVICLEYNTVSSSYKVVR